MKNTSRIRHLSSRAALSVITATVEPGAPLVSGVGQPVTRPRDAAPGDHGRASHARSLLGPWPVVLLMVVPWTGLPSTAFAQLRGDFNGDGYADLAIGAPGEDFQGQIDAGVVHILYGSSAGLRATGVGAPATQLWSQASPGMPGGPETGARFGGALAVGDFNGDGYMDLAIAAPSAAVEGRTAAGAVHILYGSNGGLQATGAGGPVTQRWSQASAGVAGEPEEQDQFGLTLAASDFDGDGHADLAIGAEGEDLQGQIRAGVVNILYGSNGGLQATGIGGRKSQLWSQASAGVLGEPEFDDRFGAVLAAGDFDGDSYADLAIGVSSEEFPDETGSGVVHVLYGSNAGLQATGVGGRAPQLWSQATPGISETGGGFGFALAVGDLNGDGYADLAIDVLGGEVPSAGGVVQVVYGSKAGLQATGVGAPATQLWSQASLGVPGFPEPDDAFGWALAANDFNGDGYADLAIGVPGEAHKGQSYAGVVHILYGSNAGLRAGGRGGPASQLWSQGSLGLASEPESLDEFGIALAVGDFNGDGFADLTIAVPFESFQGQSEAGVVHVLYGSNTGLQATGVGGPAAQLWSQASAGVPSGPEASDLFGWRLASQ